MSPNQADDSDDYTVIESAPHVNETFMSQVGAIQYLLIIDYVSDSQLSVQQLISVRLWNFKDGGF